MKVKLIAMVVAVAASAAAPGGVLDNAWIKGTTDKDPITYKPTGLAKLWNNIPGNKEIHWVQGSQHGYVPPEYKGRDFVREQK